jgi:hypothetical protein
MKKIKFFACLFLLIASNCFGQQCDCGSLAKRVSHLLKNKYAGYSYKANTKTYVQIEHEIGRKATKASENKCGDLIFEQLKYFGDKHIWFSQDISDEQYSKLGKKITNADINKKWPGSLEGLWTSDDKFYTLLFLHENNRLKGFVVDAKLGGYKKGDLKMEVLLSGRKALTSINYERWNGVLEKQYKICTISGSKIVTDIFRYTKTPFDSLKSYGWFQKLNISITMFYETLTDKWFQNSDNQKSMVFGTTQ